MIRSALCGSREVLPLLLCGLVFTGGAVACTVESLPRDQSECAPDRTAACREPHSAATNGADRDAGTSPTAECSQSPDSGWDGKLSRAADGSDLLQDADGRTEATRDSRMRLRNTASFRSSYDRIRVDDQGNIYVLGKEEEVDRKPQSTLTKYSPEGLQQYRIQPHRVIPDFAVHPSGDVTLLIEPAGNLAMLRVNREGQIQTVRVLSDTSAKEDLYYGYEGTPDTRSDCQEKFSYEVRLEGSVDPYTPRIEALGEDVFVATQRCSSLKLFRARTSEIFPTWVSTFRPAYWNLQYKVVSRANTFDLTRQVNKIGLAVDADGTSYVSFPVTCMQFEVLNRVWQTTLQPVRKHCELPADEGLGGIDIVVSAFGPDGKRKFVTVVGTPYQDQVAALAVTPSGLYIGGSFRQLKEGSGGSFEWDLSLIRLDKETGSQQYMRTYDVEKNDIMLDFVASGSGTLVGVGSSGWAQVDTLSIVAAGRGMVQHFDEGGNAGQNELWPPTERHQEIRAVVLDRVQSGLAMYLSGTEDGPITHTGDTDSSLDYEHAFVERRPVQSQ